MHVANYHFAGRPKSLTKYKPSLYELDPDLRSTIPISLGIPPPPRRPIQTKLSWAKTAEWDAKQEAFLADLNKPYDEKFGTPEAANNDPGAANANRKRKRMDVVLRVRPEKLARLSGSFIKRDEEKPRLLESKKPDAKQPKPKGKKKTAKERKEIAAKAAATRKRNAEKKKEAAEESKPVEKKKEGNSRRDRTQRGEPSKRH